MANIASVEGRTRRLRFAAAILLIVNVLLAGALWRVWPSAVHVTHCDFGNSGAVVGGQAAGHD